MRRLAAAVLACLMATPAFAQVSRPNPSPTAQGDKRMGIGFPVMPTPLPTCPGAGKNRMFADSAGCIYACAGTTRDLVAGNASCAFPTGAQTATPTPTATATATPTATPTSTATATATATDTATPTPTVTATP